MVWYFLLGLSHSLLCWFFYKRGYRAGIDKSIEIVQQIKRKHGIR